MSRGALRGPWLPRCRGVRHGRGARAPYERGGRPIRAYHRGGARLRSGDVLPPSHDELQRVRDAPQFCSY